MKVWVHILFPFFWDQWLCICVRVVLLAWNIIWLSSLLDLSSFFFAADCFCWTQEVQCKFSACVSTYQGFDFPNIRRHPCDTYCISGNDNAGYHSVYSCFHANWLGFTFGEYVHSFKPRCAFNRSKSIGMCLILLGQMIHNFMSVDSAFVQIFFSLSCFQPSYLHVEGLGWSCSCKGRDKGSLGNGWNWTRDLLHGRRE